MMPNFLIIGAPKCGTTSLYYYLNQHPEIFLPELKEPHFFSRKYKSLPFNGPYDDRFGSFTTKDMTLQEYTDLFSGSDNHKRVGEASADYMYYHECAKDIRKTLGDISIIAILRNPIDRTISAYTHMKREQVEDLELEEALKQEAVRKKQNWDFMWHYTSVGFYYQQLLPYYETFNKIYVLKFENLFHNLKHELSQLCEFLDVDNSFSFNTSRKHNISGIPKIGLIQKLLKKPSFIKSVLQKTIPTPTRIHITSLISNFNLEKMSINPSLRKELYNIFKDDITLTQELIQIDLSDWHELKT